MKKMSILYFLELLKFQKIKWSYFFSFFGLYVEILTICAFDQSTKLTEYLKGKSLFPEAGPLSFKVEMQHPRDLCCFLEDKKFMLAPSGCFL